MTNLRFYVFVATFLLSLNFSLSIVIECKRQREMCIVSSNVKIDVRGTLITEVRNNDDNNYNALLLKDARIEFLPNGLSKNFIKLEILKVNNATLKEVSKESFEGLNHLTTLNLEKNLIEILPVDVFESLEGLKKLFLDENKIKYLPSKIFMANSQLEEVSLMNNKLQSINGETFKNLKALKRLYLTGNELEDLKSGTFDNNEELLVVHLRNNHLKYIPENIFERNTALKFEKCQFSDNKCVDRSKKITNHTIFVEMVKESCKPLNFEMVNEMKLKIDELTNNLKTSEANLKDKTSESEKLSKKNSEYKETIQENDEKIMKLEEKVDEASEKAAALSSQVKESQNKILALESDKSKLKSELSSQAEFVDKLQENFNVRDSEAQRLLKLLMTSEGKREEIENKNKKLEEEVADLRAENVHKTKSLNEIEEKLTEKSESCNELEEKINKSEIKVKEKDMIIELFANKIYDANKTIESLQRENCDGVVKNTNQPSTKSLGTYNIPCNFIDYRPTIGSKVIGTFYTCNVGNFVSLDCSTSLSKFNGQHSTFKRNNDATGVKMSFTSLNNFPSQVFKEFSALKYLEVFDSNFGKVERICSENLEYLDTKRVYFGGDSVVIKNCGNLIHLALERSNLKAVSVENLKYLTDISLKFNIIEEIPEHFFASMTNLKNVQFNNNKISRLEGNTFANNLKLDIVNFSDNPIKFIGGEIFKFNNYLSKVQLNKCHCINMEVKKEIETLKKTIIEKCQNS